MSMSCARRAEFESAVCRGVPRDFSVFTSFSHSTATDQKSSIAFSTSNTTTAHTQMDLPFVGVQGHQKSLENTESLMKIDVFLCLVVQDPPPLCRNPGSLGAGDMPESERGGRFS